MPTNEERHCVWCHHETLKLYHHGEYAWSDRFSLDQKSEVHVCICGHCGKVTIIDAD